jgi:hypothetical protein
VSHKKAADGGESHTKKAADGGFLNIEDAKVGLLVSFFWLFPVPPSLRLVSRVQTRICSCIGLPGIALLILSEFLKVFLSLN